MWEFMLWTFLSKVRDLDATHSDSQINLCVFEFLKDLQIDMMQIQTELFVTWLVIQFKSCWCSLCNLGQAR